MPGTVIVTPSPADLYRERFRRVLDYIDAHLEEELRVERLSEVAAFSKYHFHRQFSELFGLGVSRYVQLLRMRRASFQLAFREERVLDIAISSGYESAEAFARAFKKSFGQTPSEFREGPEWDPWHTAYQQVSEMRSQMMRSDDRSSEVRVVEFPETRVAVYEHRGDPNRVGDSIRRFIEWRRETKLPPRIGPIYNIAYDNPDDTPAEDFRFDLCAATERPIEPNQYGVVARTIPSGRCAVLRHVGSDDGLAQTVRVLYSQWLPASGEETRDYPLFFHRVNFFPDVPEHEAETDVYLPLL